MNTQIPTIPKADLNCKHPDNVQIYRKQKCHYYCPRGNNTHRYIKKFSRGTGYCYPIRHPLDIYHQKCPGTHFRSFSSVLNLKMNINEKHNKINWITHKNTINLYHFPIKTPADIKNAINDLQRRRNNHKNLEVVYLLNRGILFKYF